MLIRLFAALVEVCLLRRGPQDLPHRPSLVVVLLFAAVLLELYSSRALGVAADDPGPLIVSGLFALVAPWLILHLRGVSARYWQTLLALIGTGLAFSLMALPLMLALGPLDPANPPPMARPLVLLLALLVGWRLVVAGHIWRHALQIPLPIGVLVGLGVFMGEFLVQRALFAVTGASQ